VKISRRRAISLALAAFVPGSRSFGLLRSAQTQPDRRDRDVYMLGSAYYPEQWDRKQWRSDFEKMRDLGFGTVRMGEFAWAFFETSPGEFHFDWMDEAVEIARENHICVIMGTPTASVPPWLYKLHPDVLGDNERGHFDYGGRKGLSVFSPSMRDAASRIVRALAQHYGNNPAVAGWQISNELAFPFTNYDAFTLHAYREWLKTRYSTIDALNNAWGGNFWSNKYDSWDEIGFPNNSAEVGWNGEMRLDYRRFFSDSFIEWLGFESEIVRRYARNQFVFTNWPDVTYSVDIFKASQLVDYTAWDNYSPMPGDFNYEAQYQAGLNHDLSRGANPGGRFLVAEQAPVTPVDSPKGAIRLQSFLDMAHGSSGTIYFEWRPPLAGNEQGTPSVLEVDGRPGAAYEELRVFATDVVRLWPALRASTTESDLAMIYSYDNEFYQGFWQGPKTYESRVYRFYVGLKSLQRNVDLVSPDVNLSRYRMVVAPGLEMVTDAQAQRMVEYVKRGGTLVLDAKAGTQDESGRIRPLAGPGVFAEIAGVHIESRPEPQRHGFKIDFGKEREQYEVAYALESIVPKGAETLATLRGSGVDGRPAITSHAFGGGTVFYVGVDSEELSFHRSLFQMLARRLDIGPILQAPEGVEVVSRVTGSREYVFLLNLTADEKRIAIAEPALDAILGKRIEGEQVLAPCGVLVIERAKRTSGA